MKVLICFISLVFTLPAQDKSDFSVFPQSEIIVQRDTLNSVQTVPGGLPDISIRKKLIRAVSFSGVVFFGGLAWYYQLKADDHFDKYRRSGNPSEMESEWNRTEELDKISGWMVVLSQACSQILILTYVEDK